MGERFIIRVDRIGQTADQTRRFILDDYQKPQPEIIDSFDPQDIAEGTSKSSCWMVLREVAETILLAAFLFLVINGLTARVRVDGPSMEPSYYNMDRIVVSRISYLIGDIERGDVIVFPAPMSPEEDYIKRIIGLPGDRIRVMGGYVYVNDIAIEEPYIKSPPLSPMAEVVVPEGSVFVMGDNRNVSSDSRSWGPLPIDDIIGKAVFVYWPFESMRLIEHYDFDLVE
jgi:signal peptidase I